MKLLRTNYKPTIPGQNVSGLPYILVVAQFLGSWFFSLLLLFVVASLVDINWTKPQLQKLMATTLHRKVMLGKLSWNLGFNGLAIGSDKIAITEKDGQPFLLAGKAKLALPSCLYFISS